jgi:hypothetical protein
MFYLWPVINDGRSLILTYMVLLWTNDIFTTKLNSNGLREHATIAILTTDLIQLA